MKKLFAVQCFTEGKWQVCQTFTENSVLDVDMEVACIFFDEEAARADLADWQEQCPNGQYRMVEVELTVKEG